MRIEIAPPAHVALGCMHACRTAEPTPGLVTLPCAGRLDLESLLLVFARGGAGALLLACSAEECRHRETGGAPCVHPAARLVARAREAIGRAGLAPERVAIRHVGPGDDVAALVAEHASALAALGDWRRTPLAVPTEGASDLPPPELGLRLVAAIEAQGVWEGEVAPAGRGETLLWPGCVELREGLLGGAGGSRPSALELCRLAGVEPRVASARCCGAPLLAAGGEGEEAFAALARSNAALVARSGAKELVAACPHCAETMREAYARVGAPLEGVDVVDLATWAAPRLDLSRARGALAVAASGRCDGAWLDPLRAGEPIPWPGCDEARQGPALRRAVDDLAAEASARGVSAVVLPCTHSASLARSVLAPGAWLRGEPVAVLDGVAALLRFADPRGEGATGEEVGSDGT